MNRRLYIMISRRQLAVNENERRRVLLEDLMICLGIPILEMILHYIPQGHRFDIFEDLGCYPSVYNTWVAFILVWLWPLIIAIADTVYCVLNLIQINRKCNVDLLISVKDDKSLDKQIYWRLTIVATLTSAGSLGLSIFSLVQNLLKLEIRPWINWEDTHLEFSQVELYPALPSQGNTTKLDRWFVVVCAFLFFALFGTSREATRNYRAVFATICPWKGLQKRATATELHTTDYSESQIYSVESVVYDIAPAFPHRGFELDLEKGPQEAPSERPPFFTMTVLRTPVSAPPRYSTF
ncbi:a-factor receptor [Marasmius crinis-equi]|uniref:A-factor receptor n=1 Tax=Marasmius crinis-equi TaxID=585013 RepID=A0ABR3FQ72_9AGAR